MISNEQAAQPTFASRRAAFGICEFAGSGAPTVNDDESKGFALNSRWYDAGAEEFYICVDPTDGAAVWIKSLTEASVVHYGNVGSFPTARLAGRYNSGTGTLEAIIVGSGLSLSAGTLSATGSGITIGSTTITSGTNNRILYQASGVVQQSGNLTFDGNSMTVVTGSASAVPLTIQGASSQTADYFQMKKSNGNTLISMSEDSIGGKLNIHANNGVLIGFYRINSGGGASGLDLAGYSYLNLVNAASTTAPLTLRTYGSGGGVIETEWQVYSSRTFSFGGYNGFGGEVKFRDLSNSSVALHVYCDSGSSNFGTKFTGGTVEFSDGINVKAGTTTGSKIATSTSQKIALWNKTPIVQPTTAIGGATRVGGGGATVTDTDTFGGYTIAQIAKALIDFGVLA